jgi:hypothetical protein
MSQVKRRQVRLVAQDRHEGQQRLQRAYQQLWRWVEQMQADENQTQAQENKDAPSSLIRAGLDPAARERSND